jgi:hypothetical protein
MRCGIGRQRHEIMLDYYQQTKIMLVSTSTDALSVF